MKRFFSENKLSLLRIAVSCLLIACGYYTEGYLSLGLFVGAYIIVALGIIIGAFKELFGNKTVEEKMLMSIASIGAMIIGEYFEATVIIMLYMIGEMLEDSAKDTSKKSIESLASIRSDRVRIKGGSVVPATDVKVGDIIEIFPGERIALDGDIIEGYSSINTSVITGESTPRDVRIGGEVLAGYLNISSPLTVRVKRPFAKSAAQRIIELAEKSLEKKTKSEKFIKKFARIYTPVVICIATLVALVPPIIDLIQPVLGDYGFKFWLYKALSMLAISCPCAFVISVPLAYFCGIGYASKKGILIKSSSVMDTLRSIEITAFDKTGTLTRSELLVTRIEACGDVDKIKLLELVAIVESKSIHPIATAVVKEARKFNLEIIEGTNYSETIGSGVECDSIYGHIKAGGRMFVDPPSGIVASVYVSLDGKYIGSIGIGDELKQNSKKAFESLRKLGVKKKIILSGDKKSKVDAVAKTLLAETAYSNLKPEDKVHALEDIMENNPGMKIAYCGDGINDVPTLARADIGIAMGAIGSDSAVETSDVIIMDDNIEKVPLAIRISKRTHRVVMSNIIISILVKLSILVMLGIPMLNFKMMYAALADVGMLIFAILNSLRAGR